MNPIIEKITIKLGGKTIELTPDEARQLALELGHLFDPPALPAPVHRPSHQPYVEGPIWIIPAQPTYPGWHITCHSGTHQQ